MDKTSIAKLLGVKSSYQASGYEGGGNLLVHVC